MQALKFVPKRAPQFSSDPGHFHEENFNFFGNFAKGTPAKAQGTPAKAQGTPAKAQGTTATSGYSKTLFM